MARRDRRARGSPGEKGREAGEERAGSGSPKVAGTREPRQTEKKFRNIYFVIFCNRNGTKGGEPLRKGAGSGGKRDGKRE